MQNKKKAAGAIFLAKDTGRILLGLRSPSVSYSGNWAFFGGKINPKEKVNVGLKRELTEELGFLPEMINMKPFDIFNSADDKFNFFSFLICVEKEFIPTLNKESSGYAWVDINHWPKPLHPGAKSFLKNPNIIDLLKKELNSIRENES